MAGVDLGGGGKHKKKGTGGAKKPKRLGFRLDMTPLVDVAFLLLTFFMFATTMSRPHAMEIKLPPTESAVVRESLTLTVYVLADGGLAAKVGGGLPQRTTIEGLRSLALERNRTVGDD